MYEYPFVKITAQGVLGEDVDIFNYSFHLISGTGVMGDIDALRSNTTLRNSIVSLIQGLHTSTDGSAPICKLDTIKFAYIGTDGKYIYDAQTATFQPLAGGYTNGAGGTAFTGAAISLQGNVPKALAGKGRFYPPMNALSQVDGFYIGSSRQSSLSVQWASILGGINSALNAEGNGLKVGIVSNKGSGAEQVVTSVRVGSVLDVQRRRKNRAYESYTNATVIVPE